MRKNTKVRQQMRAAFESWQASGMSQRAFCDREQIGLKKFHYWLRQFRAESVEPKTSGTFLEVSNNVPGDQDCFRIQYPNGVVLYLPLRACGTDLPMLKELVS